MTVSSHKSKVEESNLIEERQFIDNLRIYNKLHSTTYSLKLFVTGGELSFVF